MNKIIPCNSCKFICGVSKLEDKHTLQANPHGDTQIPCIFEHRDLHTVLTGLLETDFSQLRELLSEFTGHQNFKKKTKKYFKEYLNNEFNNDRYGGCEEYLPLYELLNNVFHIPKDNRKPEPVRMCSKCRFLDGLENLEKDTGLTGVSIDMRYVLKCDDHASELKYQMKQLELRKKRRLFKLLFPDQDKLYKKMEDNELDVLIDDIARNSSCYDNMNVYILYNEKFCRKIK